MSSIVEVGIAQGYLVPNEIDYVNVDVDTWSCIRDISIIDGIVCYYYEDDEDSGLIINNKKEEDCELSKFELEITDIFKERMFYDYWNSYD